MDPERTLHTMQRWTALRSALAGCAYIACFGLAIWQLTTAERSGLDDAWVAFWVIVALTGFTSLFWLVPAAAWRWTSRVRASGAALRQSALALDPALARPVADQPVPLTSEELPAAPETFGPFMPPEVHSASQPMSNRLKLLIVAEIGVAQGMLLVTGVYNSIFAWLSVYPAVVATLAVSASAFVVTLSSSAFQKRIAVRQLTEQRQHGIRLVADATELHSEPLPGYPAVAVPWREARAFYTTLPPVPPTIMQGTAFCLDTGTRAVTWWLTPDATPEERAAHDRLCRHIVSRTSLPLRDVTRAANDIARPTVAGRRRTRVRRVGTIAFVLAPLVALILLALVALDMRIYQVQGFVTQVPAIQSQTPLFRDPLTAPDGYWPVHPASATQAAYSFAEGMYRITGGPEDQSPEALTQRPYGDVAVEVTARQRGGSGFEGVGLVLRANAARTDKITFSVSPNGTWTVTRYQANPTGGAPTCTYPILDRHSRFIHAGTDRANTLFVLMRGASYFFFVNGLYLGSYVDTAPHPLASGYSGLYLEDSTTTGLFSDFAVYPAP